MSFSLSLFNYKITDKTGSSRAWRCKRLALKCGRVPLERSTATSTNTVTHHLGTSIAVVVVKRYQNYYFPRFGGCVALLDGYLIWLCFSLPFFSFWGIPPFCITQACPSGTAQTVKSCWDNDEGRESASGQSMVYCNLCWASFNFMNVSVLARFLHYPAANSVELLSSL